MPFLGNIKIWDVATGRLLKTLETSASSTIISYSPNSKLLASGSREGSYSKVEILDIATERLIKSSEYHSSPINSITYSPDGKSLASGSDAIKIWDVNTGHLLKTLTPSSAAESLCYSPDGKFLASSSGSSDGIIKIWNVATGSLVKTLAGHSHPIRTVSDFHTVNSISYSPDGRSLVLGSLDKTVKIWDVATGSLLKDLTGHSASVESVSYSLDGRTLASGSKDNTVKIWDVSSGKLLRTLRGHSHSVESVSYSADGRLLASGSLDGSVKIWNGQSGQKIAEMVSFNDGSWVTLTREGYYMSSHGGEKHINIIDDMKVWSVEEYGDDFNRPDLVREALQLSEQQ